MTVGVLILMYTAVLILMGRRMHDINTESLILRFANTDLVHSLREQKTELKAQIEERIRLEEAILRDEEKYRQLAENVGDVLMLIRSAEPYSFIYVSPAYQKMIGRDVQELYENPAIMADGCSRGGPFASSRQFYAIYSGRWRFQPRIQDAWTQRSGSVDVGDRLSLSKTTMEESIVLRLSPETSLSVN